MNAARPSARAAGGAPPLVRARTALALGVGALLVLLCLDVRVFSGRSRPEAPAVTQAASWAAASDASLRAELAELRRELQGLRSALGQSSARAAQATPGGPGAALAGTQRPEELVDTSPEQAAQLAQGRVGALEDGFVREAVDAAWSASTEAHIAERFERSPELAAVTLASSECRSTVCKVELFEPDPSVARATAARLVEELGAALPSAFTHIEAAGEGARVIAFLARPQAQLARADGS